jgi:hypothetical protein
MKYLISGFLMLTLSTALWAQADCACEQSVTKTDVTCTAWSGCTAPTDACDRIQFTAACTGHYTLLVSLSCTSGQCSDYNVCAMLYDQSGNSLGHCFDIGDSCTPCYNTCTTLCLFSGQVYTLYVCLTSCGNNQCPSPASCTASGTVKYCGPIGVSCS